MEKTVSCWFDPDVVLPLVGRRIEVEWGAYPPTSNKGQPHSTVGAVIEHQYNTNKEVVFHPDSYETHGEGWFIRRGGLTIKRWRYVYYEQAVDPTKPVQFCPSEGESVFTATSVPAKGGYRAQVTYNYKVVWEGTAIYQDDEGSSGLTGQTKAQNAAQKVVDQAVDTLFAKIKE